MDAVKFIKEAKRMCQSYEKCEACPAHTGGYDDCRIDAMNDIDEEIAVDIVEKWAKERPRKTRSSEFLKHYPNAIKYGDVLYICPKKLDESYNPCNGCSGTSCYKCREEYWLQEVE
nr:MAG TPA: hypothetical protein [Caudoviricetes sp.]